MLARELGQALVQVPQRLELVQVLEEEEEEEEGVAEVQEVQGVGPQWRRHIPQRLSQVSKKRRASSIRWCRFSTPDRQRHCASCQRFERRRRLRVLR